MSSLTNLKSNSAHSNKKDSFVPFFDSPRQTQQNRNVSYTNNNFNNNNRYTGSTTTSSSSTSGFASGTKLLENIKNFLI